MNGLQQTSLSNQAVAQAISSAIREELGLFVSPKTVSQLTGCNPRTARNWIDGNNAPNATELIGLMSAFPAVTLSILKLANQSPDDHAERNRKAAEILMGGISIPA